MRPKEKLEFLSEVFINKALSIISPGNRPNVFILGAQKAGTSSLYSYLRQHPKALASVPKEVNYFDHHIHFGKSFTWYEKHFIPIIPKTNKLIFEATPNYLYDPDTPRYIADYNRDAKLIITLRNPIDRAYSAWNMYRDQFEKGKERLIKKEKRPGLRNPLYYDFFNRKEFPTFDEAIEIELNEIQNLNRIEPAILRRGLYAEQIKRYLEYFNSDQIQIIGFKELTQTPLEVVNKICHFLQVDEFSNHTLDTKPRNVRGYKSKISEEALQTLSDFYKAPNEELKKMIGHIPEW